MFIKKLSKKSNSKPGPAQRMDAFTDGVFSIVATLLVLDIRLPEIKANHTQEELLMSLMKVAPSLVAFTFTFLSVMIYWINQDHFSSLLKGYTPRLKYLNLFFLFWICLIPFPTKLISEYPQEQVAIITYGITMLMVAASANLIGFYVSFNSELLPAKISMKARRKFAVRNASGIVIYVVAIAAAFLDVKISIGIYILTPLLYVLLPKFELEDTV
jgi:uncharacterized membrane protein